MLCIVSIYDPHSSILFFIIFIRETQPALRCLSVSPQGIPGTWPPGSDKDISSDPISLPSIQAPRTKIGLLPPEAPDQQTYANEPAHSPM
ncbi:hypothetical protein ILYODFUR_034775 [Ilyodon furcidens]|uniref:Uncharacterized protein n=1 Tax=Ilyodon furcidens TaxID=33524 RepID=A0ABV0UAV5_9TELE